jgi:hypothetical protein
MSGLSSTVSTRKSTPPGRSTRRASASARSWVADVVQHVLDVHHVQAAVADGQAQAVGQQRRAVGGGQGHALRHGVEAEGDAAVLGEAAHVPAVAAADLQDAANVGPGQYLALGGEVGQHLVAFG